MTAPQIRYSGPLADEMARFVSHKRALGRRYDNEAKALRMLDRFLVDRGVVQLGDVTAEVLDAFLASRPRTRPRSYNVLLRQLRGLFNWLVGQGVLEQSPLRASIRRRGAPRVPYIFGRVEARKLLDLASALPDNNRAPLRGPTYRAIFAILYGLGLRVGEVSRLRYGDFDRDRMVLVIRQSKFGKSRLIPVGPRMATLLKDFAEVREQRNGRLSAEDPLFSFGGNRPVHPGTISQTFKQLMRGHGPRVLPGASTPHLHDLRHSFAVGTLLRWYREGIDPSARLLQLATFMGHVDPTSTAVYLTMTAELLKEANSRFEAFAASAIGS
jgi:integrase